MRRALRDNGLSLAMFGLFAVSVIAMSLAGQRQYNADQRDHGQSTVSYAGYLTSGAFVEGVFENWESEFLQMGAFVMLTVYLYQKGSPESKKPGDDEPVEEDPRTSGRRDAPFPVRTGGAVLWLYERSLGMALLGLFVLSFVLHAAGGARDYSATQQAHGGGAVGVLGFMATSQFWFQSFQNWQSEFLSVGVLVVLGVFLRHRGSPESKPVAAAHAETGSE